MFSRVSALILAGGQSSRMGTDKALLLWQGKPLLRRVYDVASQCCECVQVLTPWPERYLEILPSGAEFLLETHPGRGPLWAICQGLNQAQAEWVWVLACDLPNLELEAVSQWLCLTESVAGTIKAIAPQHGVEDIPVAAQNTLQTDVKSALRRNDHGMRLKGRRWEPLCAMYRVSLGENLTRFLRGEGDKICVSGPEAKAQSAPSGSLQSWLDAIAVHPVPITQLNRKLFHNCNRPSDLECEFGRL